MLLKRIWTMLWWVPSRERIVRGLTLMVPRSPLKSSISGEWFKSNSTSKFSWTTTWNTWLDDYCFRFSAIKVSSQCSIPHDQIALPKASTWSQLYNWLSNWKEIRGIKVLSPSTRFHEFTQPSGASYERFSSHTITNDVIKIAVNK